MIGPHIPRIGLVMKQLPTNYLRRRTLPPSPPTTRPLPVIFRAASQPVIREDVPIKLSQSHLPNGLVNQWQ